MQRKQSPANSALKELLGADSPLAAVLPGFAPRPEQLEMAEAVATAIDQREQLLIEAGTGTGKTLAYLLPLLDANRRAIVATGTRTLQDQLFHRDLPTLSRALGRAATVRLLKGRSNYLCLQRLERARLAAPRGVLRDLTRVDAWAAATTSGDIAELSGIPDEAPIWPQITSTVHNCLGTDCPFYRDCYLVQARQSAREADIVVVNHHLLLADLAIRDGGFGELLPGVDVVVVDEAHHFPDVAQSYFNTSLSSGQVTDMLSDIRDELAAGGQGSDAVDASLRDLRDALARLADNLPSGQDAQAWNEGEAGPDEALAELGEQLDELAESLRALPDESSALRRSRERARQAAAAVETILGAGVDSALRWIRRSARGFSVNLTPLDISAQLAQLLESQPCNWIFTSATLAVGEDFSHFRDRLGLQDIACRRITSPFDFARIARLYLPADLPEPNAPGYTSAVVSAALPLVEASRGRAFLLFTSHRALRLAADELTACKRFRFPLLVQGEAPRSRLLEQYAALPDAVLLGTATFWEGVDIRGDGLVLVVIDRLPFASPADPLLAARLDALRRAGGNPFRDYQLPQAVLALKQGVGRLIRDYDDHGVVMICDPRLQRRSYGGVFLKSLPPMPVLNDPDAACRFLTGAAELSGSQGNDEELPW